MKREYATPLAFKAALEGRVAARARQSGRTINRVRQVLVMERFLVRVFDRLEGVVLKGGLVMELRLDRARTTRDVDIRVPGEPDGLLDLLREAVSGSAADRMEFEVERDAEHPTIQAEGLRYGGQRFRVTPSLAGRPYGDVFGLDAALGERLVGVPQTIQGNDILGFAGIQAPSFRVYPVETHLAEKLHAYTMPRPRPNSRVKDLPDIALLATVGALDASGLRSAIRESFSNRGTHTLPAVLPDPPATWKPVYARMARIDQLPGRTSRS